uniref:Cation_ATPase_C domain-containing protein n=1 Tax=Macrostomum lignano TaxID=282301 RepID=A0A1I8ICE0_9PLAT
RRPMLPRKPRCPPPAFRRMLKPPPSTRSAAAPQSGDASLAEQPRQLRLTGTLVRSGCGRGLVVAPAPIAPSPVYRAVQEAEAPRTPFGSWTGWAGSSASAPLHQAGIIGVSLAVAAIPEGLPMGNLVPALEARGLRSEFRRLQEWPFNSDTKVMMVKCERPAQPAEAPLLLAKGAPDCLLSRCASYWAPSGQPAPMTSSASAAFAAQAARMGARGLRVLAAAAGNAEQPEGGGLVFCGLVGLLDPPRPGVREAVACLRESGVLVAMVTGDSAETACAVARQIGLAGGEPGDPQQPLSGDQLDGLPAGDPRIAEARIFYRTSPRHKSKIVRAFQAAGRVVAMTGDGVNDAVALKAADIGVAMGRSGTEVAMEAADMILTDDSFRTILSAVEEGKAIFHNIRCFIRFQLSTSVAALSLVAMATLFSLPSPLNAMQILWINILMDGPPAQSLGLEPLDPEIRRRPPRRASEPVLPPAMLLGVLRSAAVIVAGTLFVFYREMSDNRVTPRDTTMTFTCFVLFDMFNALSCRSKSKSVFSVGLLTNRAFCLSVGMSLVGQLLVIYCPPFQAVFQTEALSALDLLFLLSLSSSVFLAVRSSPSCCTASPGLRPPACSPLAAASCGASQAALGENLRL